MAKERQRARLSDANALFQQQHASAAADAAAVAADGNAPGTAAGREADRGAAAMETISAGPAPAGAAETPGVTGAAPPDDIKAEVRAWALCLGCRSAFLLPNSGHAYVRVKRGVEGRWVDTLSHVLQQPRIACAPAFE